MALQDINVGYATVTWGGTSLGETEGEVRLEVITQRVNQASDTYGVETPYDMIEVGRQLKVTVPMSEYSFSILQNIVQTADTAGGKLKIGKIVGASTRALAKKLVIHPIIKGNDLGSDITLHKAVVSSETIEVSFSNDRSQIEVEFMALIDSTNTDGILGYIGTPA
jgi:hypothetical protein